jgi:hypothetical protein
MLATDSIDPSVKNLSFLTDNVDHQSPQNVFFYSIETSA